jgi:hypothetical protein
MAGMHNMMMGMGYGVTITLISDNYSVDVVSGGTLEWGLLSATVITNSDLNGQESRYDWITPSSQSPNYWIRVTQTSGLFDYGSSVNTWVDTATDPYWGITRFTAGTTEVTFTAQISSDSSGTNILATATINLSVRVGA